MVATVTVVIQSNSGLLKERGIRKQSRLCVFVREFACVCVCVCVCTWGGHEHRHVYMVRTTDFSPLPFQFNLARLVGRRRVPRRQRQRRAASEAIDRRVDPSHEAKDRVVLQQRAMRGGAGTLT